MSDLAINSSGHSHWMPLILKVDPLDPAMVGTPCHAAFIRRLRRKLAPNAADQAFPPALLETIQREERAWLQAQAQERGGRK